MTKVALFIKIKTKPGKRDEVRELWEKFLKGRAEAKDAQELYTFCGLQRPSCISEKCHNKMVCRLYGKRRSAVGWNARSVYEDTSLGKRRYSVIRG
jgi:hypothetical protein